MLTNHESVFCLMRNGALAAIFGAAPELRRYIQEVEAPFMTVGCHGVVMPRWVLNNLLLIDEVADDIQVIGSSASL